MKYIYFSLCLLFSLLVTGCLQQSGETTSGLFQKVEVGKSVNVSCFVVEPNGSLWMGLDGEGMAYRETQEKPFQFYNKLSGTLPSDVVICAFKDSQKRIWFGSFGNGPFYYQNGAFHTPDNESLRTSQLDYVSGFAEDSQRNLWIATMKDGLFCCDSTGHVSVFNKDNSPLTTNFIADLKYDSDTLFVATGWGMFVLDTKTKIVRPLTDQQGDDFLNRQMVRIMEVGSDGKLWMGTRSGLYIYDRLTQTYTRLTADDGMADNYILALGRDKQGNIWAASEHAVTRVVSDGTTFTCNAFSPDKNMGDVTFHVRAVTCMPNGDMLFGSSKGCFSLSPNHLQTEGLSFSWTRTAILVLLLLGCGAACGWGVKALRRKRTTASADFPLEKTVPAGREDETPEDKPLNRYADIEPSAVEVTSLDMQLKEKAIRIVQEHIDDSDFSVEDMSDAIGMSRAHLYKRLLAITGKTPIEFIRVIRVKQGRQLLEQSGESISQVAYRVGMSPKQFAKYFKEEYGVLPSEYMKNKQ